MKIASFWSLAAGSEVSVEPKRENRNIQEKKAFQKLS